MSNWKGFLQESKSYMGYPDGGRGRFAEWNYIGVVDGGWTVRERSLAKFKFWKAYPRAWIRFHWFCFADWARAKLATRQ